MKCWPPVASRERRSATQCPWFPRPAIQCHCWFRSRPSIPNSILYGTVVLDPAGDLRQVLTDATVVVADDLLIRLHTQVGASLKIGDSTFRIAAVLVREPDRMSSGMGLGPRVMMTQSALEKSGLLQQGSRSGERFLFKLSPTAEISPPCARGWSRCCRMRRSRTSGKAIRRSPTA